MVKRLGGDLVLNLAKFHVLTLKVAKLSENAQLMKPDIDGWVPMQRLLERCKQEFGQEYEDVRRLFQAPGEIGLLTTLMAGVEISERPIKNGVQLMYRVPA